nr:SOS response-associated peptidase [Bifidobacterium sp. ESL0745]
MCRRFSLDLDWNAVGREFEVDSDQIDTPSLPARTFRVEPHQQIGVIAADHAGERHLRGGYWSLVPSWNSSAKLDYPTYNARMESAAQKPTFRDSARHCRAIIPAAGYFEFKNNRPFYFHAPGNLPLAMAGLYSWWRPSTTSSWVLTATVMTCAAIDGPRKIHDRMPLLVPTDLRKQWLDPDIDGSGIILEIHNKGRVVSENLEYYEVAEPKADEDGPQCIHPIKNNAPLSLF